jgi:hypothetical protein
MEVAVRKATRLEYIPPKQKHLQSNRIITLSTFYYCLLIYIYIFLISTYQFDFSEPWKLGAYYRPFRKTTTRKLMDRKIILDKKKKRERYLFF